METLKVLFFLFSFSFYFYHVQYTEILIFLHSEKAVLNRTDEQIIFIYTYNKK